MRHYATEQEAFWAGEFGDGYVDRNQGAVFVANNVAFFSDILSYANGVRSVLELGANIGLNLQAIRQLLPGASLSAVEINAKAIACLRELPFLTSVHEGSILDSMPDGNFDLVFTKGVLIHFAPELLPTVYERMVEASNRYILVAEYYNPSPVEVPYRGHRNKLFKRDFCSEIMDRHANLKLVSYGFRYRRDLNWPQDDLTWFLMEKC